MNTISYNGISIKISEVHIEKTPVSNRDTNLYTKVVVTIKGICNECV